MTFEQAFLKIKSKFDNADTAKLSDDFAIQVNMTDEDSGGAFYIQYTDGKLFVEPYDYHDNTADITAARLDLYKIIDGKLSIEKALETGKLYVNGNIEDLRSAVSCVKIVPKAPAVKKKTEKPSAKSTPKKTTKK